MATTSYPNWGVREPPRMTSRCVTRGLESIRLAHSKYRNRVTRFRSAHYRKPWIACLTRFEAFSLGIGMIMVTLLRTWSCTEARFDCAMFYSRAGNQNRFCKDPHAVLQVIIADHDLQ